MKRKVDMGKVPETIVGNVANNDESLMYQEQDEEGRVRTLWTPHPHGVRAQRRFRQRHHPYFTKVPTRGRLWRIALADDQRARQKNQ